MSLETFIQRSELRGASLGSAQRITRESAPLGNILQRQRVASSTRSSAMARRWHSVLTAGMLAFGISVAPAKVSATAEASAPAGRSQVSQSGDSQPCLSCHEDIVQSFASNPHSKGAGAGSNRNGCDACHGPGKKHLDSGGDETKIFNPAKASVEQVNQTCLGCHSGHLSEFTHSLHSQAKLSCVSCHSVHGADNHGELLKLRQPEVCLQCHADVATYLSMFSHHPMTEGRVECSVCHDPHGIVAKEKRPVTEVNATCTKCHTRQAGPFVYEHQVIEIEGCLSCHSPHGSQNAHLLNRADVNTQCQLCHSVSGSLSHSQRMLPAGHADSRTAQTACCTDCHAQFHGSNLDKDFLR